MRDPVLVVLQSLFNHHLNVPWEHTILIKHLKMQVGVCTHDTLDKVLTEPVSPLRLDPTFDRPVMITYRRRTGRTVCAKNPDHDRSYHCGACDYHGIDTDKFRNATNYQVHRKIIKWFTQECVPPYGSAWTACETT